MVCNLPSDLDLWIRANASIFCYVLKQEILCNPFKTFIDCKEDTWNIFNLIWN